MKIKILTAATIVVALTSSTAFADKSYGPAPKLTNDAKNSLAIGSVVVGAASGNIFSGGEFGFGKAGGRAIAGSIYLEDGACNCRLGNMKNTARNSIAVGNATAGSIHINTPGYGGNGL